MTSYRLYVKNNTMDEDVFSDANEHWLKKFNIEDYVKYTEYDLKFISIDKMPMKRIVRRGSLDDRGFWVDSENGSSVLNIMGEINKEELQEVIIGKIQDIQLTKSGGYYEVKFTREFYSFELTLQALQWLIQESSTNYLKIIQEGYYIKNYQDGYTFFNAIYLETGMV